MSKIYLSVFLCWSVALQVFGIVAEGPKKVIIGYVGGYRGRVIPAEQIHVNKMTHINYAFAKVVRNRVRLAYTRTDSINLVNLIGLKKKNPALKVLLSVGGWSWSDSFSEAALSDTSRQAFAASAVDLLKRFHLDGLDIDWEYPGMAGSGHHFLASDKQNFTLLLKALRLELDLAGRKLDKRFLLTAATGAFRTFLKHTEMGKVQVSLDYINLMTYDYFGGNRAVHHSNLYASASDPRGDSADKAVRDYIAAGVPISKLVMGLAFYGRMFQLDSTARTGLGDRKSAYMQGRDFYVLQDEFINKNGFQRYQDTSARAPYLFNPKNRQFITYEDGWSVGHKCKYVIDHQMAGVMFWEYDADPNSQLLDQIQLSLKNMQSR
ncbi:glycoside hydrolase family 18 protein [Mucilaginibacter sp. PAMB04274]|uniref:glycoside hydrolase family 18 protein n=1 Tax=Mucilaginibacter sp. PAMB04274 TaxID=3138568 RepID=UPI0031F6713E